MRKRAGMTLICVGVSIFFLAASEADAQITIDMDDVPTEIGASWAIFEGDNPVNFDVESTGPNYNWDFSHVDTLEYYSIPETVLDPALSQFEDVNLLFDWQMEILPGMFYVRKFHINLTESAYVMKAMEGFSYPPAGDSLTWVMEQGIRYYEFPMTYGASWTSITDGYIYGNGVLGDSLRNKYEIDVDGWGKVTTPYETASCLRMKVYLSKWDFDLGVYVPNDTSFLWLTNEPEFRLVFEVSGYKTEEEGKEGYVRVYDPAGAGVTDDLELPQAAKPSLAGNCPNPFNPVTSIRFVLPSETRTKITIYDITGRRVKTLVDATMSAGEHSAVWHGSNDSGGCVSSGVYIYELRAGDTCETGRMLLLK